MRESIYGPENRVVSAQLGVGYSVSLWLPPDARPRVAVPYHFSLPPPRVALLEQWYVSGPTVDGYATGTSYRRWASYNAKGEIVGTYVGSEYRKIVSVGGGGASFEFILTNWPSNGSASWIVHNGSGVGSTAGYGSRSETPSSLISPTYAEILAQDKANGTGGTFVGLYTLANELLGTKLYEDSWSNGLNGSLSRYYNHNMYITPAGLYGGYTGVFSWNSDLSVPYEEDRWQSTHNLADELPEDIVPPAASFNTLAETYNFYIDSVYWGKAGAAATPLDRGDGVLTTYRKFTASTAVSGFNVEGLETHPDAIIEDEVFQGLRVEGTCILEATEFASRFSKDVKLARLRFTNFCVGAYNENARWDGYRGVLNGTYVAGVEDALTFTPIEQHEYSRLVTYAKDHSKIDEMYAFYRADVAKANAHLRRWAVTYFKKCMREWSQGKGTVPRPFLRKLARAAKKSNGVKREVPITLGSSGKQLSRTPSPVVTGQYDVVDEYTFTFSYTITRPTEDGGTEEVTRSDSIKGTRATTYAKSSAGVTFQYITLNNYYFSPGLAVNDSIRDVPGTRFPDKSVGLERNLEVAATGFYAYSGTYHSRLDIAEGRTAAESYFADVSDVHSDYGFVLSYGTIPTLPVLTAQVPDIIAQYMEEVPLVYAEGAGVASWAETYLYDGQQVAFTWFGPRGGGPFSPWQDTDTEVEVYGQLVCRYVAQTAELAVVRWVPVQNGSGSFLVDKVPVTYLTEDGPVVQEEDVSFPTVVAPRPLAIPQDRIFRALGDGVKTPNCIATLGAVKWTDIVNYAKQRKKEGEGTDRLDVYILSLLRGL